MTTTVHQGYEDYDFVKVYKAIHAFCNEELSSIYLDILKDRLYTSSANSLERRSAQTVHYHILDVLVRVLAPILCFTSDEIFVMMPKSGNVTTQLLAAAEPRHKPTVPPPLTPQPA